jgi:hypothetical protein
MRNGVKRLWKLMETKLSVLTKRFSDKLGFVLKSLICDDGVAGV